MLFETLATSGHEQVVFCNNPDAGLRAIVAVPVVVMAMGDVTSGLLGRLALLGTLVLLAVAVRALAEVVDVRSGGAHVAHGVKHGIHQKAYHHTHDHLEQHD